MRIKQNFKLFTRLPFGVALRVVALTALRRLLRLPVTFSYSQGGEDILLGYFVSLEREGFYVDVGCSDPIRFSNTFSLYTLGWNGINIDAHQEMIAKCKSVRLLDKSICAAVSDEEREVVFHKAVDSNVSTIDERKLEEWRTHFEYREEDRQFVRTRTLTSILDEVVDENVKIDVLDIDVEGHDLQVIKGLDFERYRPTLILMEFYSLEDASDSEACTLLKQHGYKLENYAFFTAFFIDKKSVVDKK
ncbi:MAG TPA: FkbM family methyltransferase [Aridibacter sp.]|nr:FkbM family methyltransferase [Aridibacter sp.]